jgi:hypothetical protein
VADAETGAPAAAAAGEGEPAKEPVRGPAAGCLAAENLEGCAAAQAVLAELQREFGGLLALRGDGREAAGKSREARLQPDCIKKDLDR